MAVLELTGEGPAPCGKGPQGCLPCAACPGRGMAGGAGWSLGAQGLVAPARMSTRALPDTPVQSLSGYGDEPLQPPFVCCCLSCRVS